MLKGNLKEKIVAKSNDTTFGRCFSNWIKYNDSNKMFSCDGIDTAEKKNEMEYNKIYLLLW